MGALHNTATLALLGLAGFPGNSASAADWAPPATDLPGVFDGGAAGGVRVAAEHAIGLVPAFRSASRDRTEVSGVASAWVGPAVRLELGWGWLADQTAAEQTTGPSDFRLGTGLRLLQTDAISMGLGWGAKLPNATNEDGLGTDETDVDFGAWAGLQRGPWSGVASVGLAVLGNPLRFAAQDDVPFATIEGAWTSGRWSVLCHADLALATSRNPARAEAGGGLRYGGRFFGEVGGTAGLTPAAADGRVLIAIGTTWALPRTPPGE